MPRIDPSQLLKCLSVLLSESGGIKGKDEVQRLASLMMKFSKKLVSKCIYVLILKSTEADLLDMFMSAGGWDLTFTWLSDGIEMCNWPFIEELVEMLLLCPVDIERLRGNNCPKVIKGLSKNLNATEKVRQLTCNLVEHWLSIVKGACEVSHNNVASGETEGTPAEVEVTSTTTQEVSSTSEVEENSNDSSAPKGVYKITIRDGKNVLAEVISSDKQLAGPSTEDKKEEENDGEEEKKEEKPVAETTRQVLKVVNEDPIAQESLPPKKLAEGKKQALKRKNERKPSPEPDKKSSKDKKKIITPEKKPKLDSKSKSKDRRHEKPSEKSSSKEKVKTPEEKAQEEKEKQNILKLITPSIGNLGKIPKKSKDDSKKDDKKSSSSHKPPADPKKPFPKDPKKYNISIETRKTDDRPKTVKTFNSRFRSTGLEELPPPPKSSKKKDEPVDKKPLKRPSPIKEVHPHPPEKKLKEEEKAPVIIHPPSQKPKISGLQESDVFADALTAANMQKDTKKRKRRTSISNSPTDPKKESNSTKAEEKDSKEAVKPVLKFYQDTLVTSEDKGETKEDSKDEPSEKHNEDLVSDDIVTDSLSKEELEDEVAKAEEAIDHVLKMEEKKNMEREKNRIPKGVLVYVKKYTKVKKSVSWKPEKDLEAIQFFELDETERVNVTKPFMDMKQMERINERILLSRKLVSEDIMEEKTPWRRLIPIDISGDLVVPGKNSVEKDIQRARERTTLQAIYFNRSMIPDSPAEPDLEIHAFTDPAVIPLKDQTGNLDSVISYRDKPWPEPKGYPGGSVGSPPHIASPPSEPLLQAPHGIPPAGLYPQPFQQPPVQPYMPGPALMPTPDWMGNNEGNMMMGGGQGNEGMMMGGGGMHPGLLPPPDMYHMGGPPPHPEFMAPPFPMGGPPPPGMYNNGPNNYPPHQDSNPRHQRPWFRGGSNNGGGSWRHQPKGGSWSQGNNKMCKFYLKKGICRQSNCTYRHGSGKGSIR